MPSPSGFILTNRDRTLLAYLGIARYASAEQLHRLLFGGASKKQTYRRLAKLCEPGGRPGEGPCLRRLSYRRRDGTAVPVWALAPYGRSVAERDVPWLRPPAATDIGHRFLSHTLLLNEVLLGLVLSLRRSPEANLADLPFRWLSEDDGVLSFRYVDVRTREWRIGVLKPDAVLTIPARRRRVFVEAETGSQSIATAHPDRTGALLAKLDRYARYFQGRGPEIQGTWYETAFADGYLPRLLFLVHSDERRRKVEKAIAKHQGPLRITEFATMVFTFAEAARALGPYITRGQLVPAGERAERVVTVEEALIPRIRDGFNAFVESYNATRSVIVKANARGGPPLELPPMPSEAVGVLRDLVVRLLDAKRAPEPATARVPGR